MANWKTSPVFSVVASSFGEHELFFTTFIRFYTSIYAGFRAHEKIGKPHFQLSYIIAGLCNICQITPRFSNYINNQCYFFISPITKYFNNISPFYAAFSTSSRKNTCI